MNKKNLKFTFYLLTTIILVLGLSISLQSLLAAWTAPTAAPPGSNIAKPINESSAYQIKAGDLDLNNLGVAGDLDVVGNITVSNGSIRANKHITHLEWHNFTEPGCEPDGYIKLSTPIIHNESNMFSIRIFGYEYSGGSDSIDIHCVGYAYSATTLINTKCYTEGTNIPVEIGTETRADQGGNTVVVIRLGTPSWDWYYPHLTAEYVGWQDKDPSDFKWVACETTPVQTGNTNNVFIDDQGGNIGIGTESPDHKLQVLGNVMIGETDTTGGSLYLYGTTAGKYSRILTSNGNLHIDPGYGAGGGDGLYLNYFNGGTIYFGTGATGYHSSVTTAGAWNLDSTLYTDGAGNVGIGTAGPTKKLEIGGIVGAQYEGIRIVESIAGGYYAELMWDASNNDAYLGTGASNYHLILQSAGGNVGIGTAGPGVKLSVEEKVGIGDPTNANWPSGIGLVFSSSVGDLDSAGAGIFGVQQGSWGADLVLATREGGGASGNARITIKDTGNVGIGTPNPGTYRLYVNGDMWANTYSGPGCDIAERYEVSQGSDNLEAGDVVILDSNEETKVKKSNKPYDTMVIGVISTNPNMVMGALEDNKDHPPVALLGKVPTKVTTENGPIKVGDNIVSSSKPGHGMKCDDFSQCQGAIIGKALQKLESGEGIIEILIKGGP